MNYKLIVNESEFFKFLDFLPEELDNEQYYVSLFARKKYCPQIKSDKGQLKRFTSNKKYLYDKIKQLECTVGSFKVNGIEVPQEALALYISINPRDLRKAGLNLISTISNLIKDGRDNFNPQKEALNEIQKSCSRRVFYDLDIDRNDEDLVGVMDKIKQSLNEDCLNFIKTKGGVHCAIELSKIEDKYKKTWFKDISNFGDVRGDNLIPIPGTYQGGFSPYII